MALKYLVLRWFGAVPALDGRRDCNKGDADLG